MKERGGWLLILSLLGLLGLWGAWVFVPAQTEQIAEQYLLLLASQGQAMRPEQAENWQKQMALRPELLSALLHQRSELILGLNAQEQNLGKFLLLRTPTSGMQRLVIYSRVAQSLEIHTYQGVLRLVFHAGQLVSLPLPEVQTGGDLLWGQAPEQTLEIHLKGVSP
ncbi:hypothetical protein COW36_04220 [bacterium (Candidatus Blackallbacteria) CG17_big_fil_post_rev_8_21_14_2_50_48_46]|uniref:Uncharacterized protein n=1 Tax=bacterium (Candidatus Blackallbacteria) CG17_big_fil_post_rev_8_21_14_2_50_48_46 TaxID=2014261 RepID=A0A2M7G9G7_9BACT|nr:MAG: hypothetical protein COW64_04725 [bacterium (Candidatus Blackallbacteria) CG18_big_fil_WC_8_21_14_2_50_49_26]PIW18504.1 MAG: hypothetical protein COW36_04220 [bacterium (Candidatus Blackallbacteria) CG17_big_fil_post_rev_8_21_14_2_50_48_46]PIW46511.1 MAG: hypothetical protein COW20_16460 [bacterium (Candidatus Blackallbacteria) CG13_big_fil_rev_8_21_14_2_50_49_14]